METASSTAPPSHGFLEPVQVRTAVAAVATVIVTGDLDLLVLRRYSGIDIVLPRDFLGRLPS